jgi:hypothetical protein
MNMLLRMHAQDIRRWLLNIRAIHMSCIEKHITNNKDGVVVSKTIHTSYLSLSQLCIYRHTPITLVIALYIYIYIYIYIYYYFCLKKCFCF